MSAIGELYKTSERGGICLDEYNGNYSLMAAWVNRNGEIQPNFCKVKFKNEEKTMPIKIFIGSQARAIEILKELLNQLEGGGEEEKDSSIPF